MNDNPEKQGELTFADYVRPVWRFKFIVVLVVAVAAAGTYAYTNRQQKVYESATQVFVGQSELQQLLNPLATQTPRTIADQATLVTTPTVAEQVKKQLSLPYPPDALLGAVQAVPSQQADFLTITAETNSPTLAAELANGFAKAYLKLRTLNLVNSAKAALVEADKQLAALPAGQNNVVTKNALRQQIGTLQSQLSSPPSQGQIVASAVPGGAISPQPTRNAIFAGALALVLGIIAAYLFDRGDRRVRRLEDVETLFALPVLGTIPFVRGIGRRRRGTAPEIPGAAREPHRSLRVNLDLARLDMQGRGKVIMVTSAQQSEGKSTIVRNLALSYREAGANVAVLEADMRRPVLAEQLGVSPVPGLAEALAIDDMDLALQEVPKQPGFSPHAGMIDVAVAGACYENPTVLLTGDRMHALIEAVAQDHDIVLVDTPPLLSVSDALPLLSMVDGVLVVVRVGKTTYPAAMRLRRTVERLHGVDVLGIVANTLVDELASYGYSKYERPTKPAPRQMDRTTDDVTAI